MKRFLVSAVLVLVLSLFSSVIAFADESRIVSVDELQALFDASTETPCRLGILEDATYVHAVVAEYAEAFARMGINISSDELMYSLKCQYERGIFYAEVTFEGWLDNPGALSMQNVIIVKPVEMARLSPYAEVHVSEADLDILASFISRVHSRRFRIHLEECLILGLREQGQDVLFVTLLFASEDINLARAFDFNEPILPVAAHAYELDAAALENLDVSVMHFFYFFELNRQMREIGATREWTNEEAFQFMNDFREEFVQQWTQALEYPSAESFGYIGIEPALSTTHRIIGDLTGGLSVVNSFFLRPTDIVDYSLFLRGEEPVYTGAFNPFTSTFFIANRYLAANFSGGFRNPPRDTMFAIQNINRVPGLMFDGWLTITMT